MTTHPNPDIPTDVHTPTRPDTATRPGAAATPTRAHPPRPASDASADELVADIEVTRAELGDTVDALSSKFDVKTQAQHGLDDARQRATAQVHAARHRSTQAVAQVRDAATDAQGNLIQQARVACFAAAALVAGAAVAAIRRSRR